MTRRKSGTDRTLIPALCGMVFALAAVPVSAQRVVNLPDRDKALTGAPQTVFTVGREEGDTPDVFAGVDGVTFDKAGNLYVLDRQNGHVVVFGPDGGILRTVGQKGEGPGELALPMQMATLPDGRLAILDGGNGAISLFGTDGKYQDLVRRDMQPGMMSLGGGGMAGHASGGLVMAGSQLVGGGPGGGPPEVRDSIPILLQPLDGGSKVLFSAPSPKPEVRTGGSAGNMNVQVRGAPTFSPRVMWTVLADGRLAVTYGQDYDVSIVPASGGSAAIVLHRPLTARKVTEKDRDAARERRREQLQSGAGMIRVTSVNGQRSVSMGGGGGMPAEQIERSLQQMTFAETMPVIRGLSADPDGRVWVQRDAGSGRTDYPIDILNANGTYVGTVTGIPLPDALGPGGRAAFIETDDLGVQRVSVKRAPDTWFR